MARTLLQLAGANLAVPPLAEAALVIIDAQREYVDGALPLTGVAPALDNIALLLKTARDRSAPVIHVQHRGKPGGLFDPTKPAFELAEQARALAGETVVEKGLPNSFAGTTLKQAIDATGRKTLVLAGFMTHMCVSSTARAALDLGFQTVVVGDASATRDLPDTAGGGVIAAADLHRAELSALADRFSIVCPAAALIG